VWTARTERGGRPRDRVPGPVARVSRAHGHLHGRRRAVRKRVASAARQSRPFKFSPPTSRRFGIVQTGRYSIGFKNAILTHHWTIDSLSDLS